MLRMKDLLFLKTKIKAYLPPFSFVSYYISPSFTFFFFSPFYILVNIRTLKSLFLVDYVKHATELILSHIFKKGQHHPTQAPQ